MKESGSPFPTEQQPSGCGRACGTRQGVTLLPSFNRLAILSRGGGSPSRPASREAVPRKRQGDAGPAQSLASGRSQRPVGSLLLVGATKESARVVAEAVL
jgi:hypothetical protein